MRETNHIEGRGDSSMLIPKIKSVCLTSDLLGNEQKRPTTVEKDEFAWELSNCSLHFWNQCTKCLINTFLSANIHGGEDIVNVQQQVNYLFQSPY